MPMKDKRMH